LQKPQIARTQERSLPGVREAGREGLPAQLGLIPVTLGDTRTGDPNLTDFPATTARPLVGVDDNDLLVRETVPAADQGLRGRFPRASGDSMVAFQRGLVNAQGHGRSILLATGDQ